MAKRCDAAGLRRRAVAAAARLLAMCLLMFSSARAAQNPYNVTDTGPIGASSEPLLPPLSTFVQPGPSFGDASVVLGTTCFR